MSTQSSSGPRHAAALLGLAALAVLAAPSAHAQALYVANNFGGSSGNGSITEFAPGATPGTFGNVTSFSDPSLSGPEGLAFDSRGDLFAANGGNSITEFTAGATPGTFGNVTSFSDPSLQGPTFLAFDSSGDLFADNGRGGITEFAAAATPGTFGAVTRLTDPSLKGPSGLAFRPSAPVPEASSVVSLGLLLMLGLGATVVARRRGVRA